MESNNFVDDYDETCGTAMGATVPNPSSSSVSVLSGIIDRIILKAQLDDEGACLVDDLTDDEVAEALRRLNTN